MVSEGWYLFISLMVVFPCAGLVIFAIAYYIKCLLVVLHSCILHDVIKMQCICDFLGFTVYFYGHLQGFVLKYLLFVPEESSISASKATQRSWKCESVTPENFASLSDDTKKRWQKLLNIYNLMIRIILLCHTCSKLREKVDEKFINIRKL